MLFQDHDQIIPNGIIIKKHNEKLLILFHLKHTKMQRVKSTKLTSQHLTEYQFVFPRSIQKRDDKNK